MKMSTQLKALFLILVASMLHISVFAQTKQTRKPGNFDGVSASGAVNVFLRQGNETSVVVEAREESLKYLKTEVDNGVLKIYRDKDFSWRDLVGDNKDGKVNVYITCPRLKSVTVSGASNVRGESAFTTDNFKLQSSGASDITMSVRAKSLDVSCSGASDIKLSGQADHQKVSVSGGSEYQAYSLQSRSANIQASGASEAYVSVDGEVMASASGASDIRYKGNARVVSNSSSGASSVRQAK
ncbi:head GIN domain-containing protein [Hymenobacter sp. HD11105]